MFRYSETLNHPRLRRWTRPILNFFLWVGQHELSILLAGLLLFAFLFGFVQLASEVMEGETHAADERILLALRNPVDTSDPIGPVWVEEMMRDFTSFGGSGVLTLVTLAVVVYLMLQHKFGAMTFVTVAIVGGVFLSLLLKQNFDRPRPDLVPHGTYVVNSSFPSGHAMLSAVTFLTLGASAFTHPPATPFQSFLFNYGGDFNTSGGDQPGLFGRPLAHRCVGRLGGWRGLGDLVLAGSALASAARPSGNGHSVADGNRRVAKRGFMADVARYSGGNNPQTVAEVRTSTAPACRCQSLCYPSELRGVHGGWCS